MRLQFILSETFTGLRRNISMVVSIVLVAALTLVFVGVGWLFHIQVNQSKGYWYNKVEVSIFLCGDVSSTASCSQGEVTQAQKDQIQQQLESLRPLVEKIYYENQQQAFARFTQQFKGTAILKGVTASQMPESYRVKLSNPKKFDVIASSFQGAPGIERVEDQRALLRPLFNTITGISFFAVVVALVMIVVFVLLNVIMIRLSAFSRRRETGIMRLVGASNFTIQLPFVLENVIATFLGGIVAVGILWGFTQLLVQDRLAKSLTFTSWVGVGDVFAISPAIVVGGVVLAAIVSATTLRFYLRV
jgi:cell division transport system permease protein